MRRVLFAVCVLFSLPLLARVAGSFPPGTLKFFDTGVVAAVAAPHGGIWALTADGIIRYTTAGAGTLYPTPGRGFPRGIELAMDGSIWSANDNVVSRLSPTGVVLEKYVIPNIVDLAVAPDGTLWYIQAPGLEVGRIVGGVPTLVPTAPEQPWSLAFAENGDVWILGTGFSGTPDALYRMTPAGVVMTTMLLEKDLLFGQLRTLSDGTLLVGTGDSGRVLRLPPGASDFDATAMVLSSLNGFEAAANDIWIASGVRVGRTTWDPPTSVYGIMPHDVRTCDHDGQAYRVRAIDSEGGIWVQIAIDPFPIMPFNPCPAPGPTFPDLIRIDAAQFLAAHAHLEDVPAISPTLLIAMAAVLAAAGALRLFRA